MKFQFDKKYFLLFLVILVAEIIFLVLVTNPVIVRTAGNLLGVILIYCFLQTFFNFNKAKTIIMIGVLALLVEFSQAFHVFEKWGIQDNTFLAAIPGNTFDVNDIWAYVAGCAMIYMLEFSNDNKRPKKRKLF